MNFPNQLVYRARHPKVVLITPEFPNCAAALNALFDNNTWERDEDINIDMSEEEIDISTDEGREAMREAQKEPKPKHRDGLRWRAPTETLRGPCSLWSETHEVKAAKEPDTPGAASADSSDNLPKTYTAYKLVCELDNLIDGDFQTLTRIADRHNCSLGVEAIGDKVWLQIAYVR